METFLTSLPFIAVLLIAINLYKTYKNRGKEISEKQTWLQKQRWYQYIKLVFFIRIKYHSYSAIFFIPMVFGIFFGGASLLSNIETTMIYPHLPLDKMQIQHGVIESIFKRKKMDALLVLRTTNGTHEEYALNVTDSEIKMYLTKNVTIYYSRGFSSAFTIDNIIYQITDTVTKTVLRPYDYARSLEIDQSFWKFTKYSLLIGVFSAFMIWRFNRKELPIHRLNRMKSYKKNKGEK